MPSGSLAGSGRFLLEGECIGPERGEIDAAGGGQAKEDVELLAVEGGALGGALDLDEAPVAGADDVHVGLGADVFLVAEVEERGAVDDADADRGPRSMVTGRNCARVRPSMRGMAVSLVAGGVLGFLRTGVGPIRGVGPAVGYPALRCTALHAPTSVWA
ncbi:hypothetical protein SMF913_10214 [Streptomyces malaysiensis]|uniref:Uncharacterized protein n=1 Tax=Streptomyces malaysiensis TaxID=92644 RepID=A0A2J7Z1Z5_STRMQ|nr:hypothetical protein SMF913_10214 [Streptomyces malaysiensis]